MRLLSEALVLLLASFSRVSFSISGQSEKIQNARLDKDGYEAVQRLHFAWYMTSIKALMGQLGKEVFHELNPEDQRSFARCLDNIDDQGDLTYGARCLIRARRRRDTNPLRKPAKTGFVQAPELKRKTVKMLKPVAIKPKPRVNLTKPLISNLYKQRRLNTVLNESSAVNIASSRIPSPRATARLSG
ncbi:hypothetical protein L596_001124 [Steinernema carpocapsae]|uniref:Uncharacterized protein n=1 Tax=Steinernema carpocapsae TaxID=34508 RepID=A0A4U8UKD2_STECR|nr:hypothetical protein L596_001124 [Steinernema carpocapsae]